MADIQNYLFIDGNYLARAYEAAMRTFFPNASYIDLDLTKLKAAVSASKVFFYDAIDEDLPDAAERRTRLEAISSLDGFHVREGSVSKRKKRKQQKQVDVRLAVECLTHAFNKNFWHVTLVAGDLDFKPLVDALVNLGIHVHVYYEKSSGNRVLFRAADAGQLMTLEDFWNWSCDDFRATNPLPSVRDNVTPSGNQIRTGTWSGRTIHLFELVPPSQHYFAIWVGSHGKSKQFRVAHPDRARLEEYFALRFGTIEWNPEG
jgi:uncharacterized LabA/DUF88 family protein